MVRTWGIAFLMVTLSFLGVACVPEATERPSTEQPPEPAVDEPEVTTAEFTKLRSSSSDPRVITHHWQALEFIKKGELDGAVHSVEHLLDLLSGEHHSQMSLVQSLLLRGEIHEAEHIIESMLAGVADPNLSPHQMHLELAYFSIQIDALDETLHHLEHILKDFGEIDNEQASNAISALKAQRPEEASRALESLLARAIDADAESDCLDRSAAHTGEASIVLTVLADESWMQGWRDQATFRARRLVRLANEALQEIGVVLIYEGLGTFESNNYATPADLARSVALAQTSDFSADLRLLLTDEGHFGHLDGYYSRSENSIVLTDDFDHDESEAVVLIHEIGHYMGLKHRQGTYMQPHGFPLIAIWSDCQRESLTGK